MAVELGALILFTGRIETVVEFYRTLGVPLELENHGGEADHFACDLGGLHFAVFAGEAGNAPPHRAGGSQFFGLAVASCKEALEIARAHGAPILQEATTMSFGTRGLVVDPDGRTVELFERTA